LNVPDGATSFVAIDRRLVDEMNLFNERTKYLSGLMAWLSYGRYSSIPVERRPRKHGKSKYTFRRLAELAITLVTHYSNAPLALASYLGLVLILGGAVVLVCGLAAKGTVPTGAGGSSNLPLIGTVVLFSGVQLICIGILGEYIGRIYNEVRDRPGYVIRDVLDHPPEHAAAQSERAEVREENMGAEPTA
jgi:dolichol-phosphate mannosyltransferase